MLSWGMEFTERWDDELRSGDPLTFPGYRRILDELDQESVATGLVNFRDRRVVWVETHFDRLAGTMGVVAGERIVRAFDRAAALRLPVIAVTATGGARLQEGMLALVQMGRTAAARGRHAAAGLLMAAIYGSPTTGGVYASWASLADVRAALPGATVGFGGPRVVEHVTGQRPPATSHTAESAYAAGLVDALLDQGEELAWVAGLLGLHDRPLRVPRWRPMAFGTGQILPSASSGRQAVPLARSVSRPSGLEWAAALTSSWSDLHGRDPAIRAGLATLGGQRVVVIAMDRHAQANGAARPGPAAFRLAQRAVSLAGQLSFPILTIVDTPGAEPGPAAEADGIAVEIAKTLRDIASVPTPTVAICVGEGGSGGAMALGYADRLIMLDDSVFSVITPEAAAVVLGRDPALGPEMADELRLTATELLALGIADEVLPNVGPDIVDLVRGHILAAFDAAPTGDRTHRADRATRAWLQAAPERIDLAC